MVCGLVYTCVHGVCNVCINTHSLCAQCAQGWSATGWGGGRNSENGRFCTDLVHPKYRFVTQLGDFTQKKQTSLSIY